MDRVADAVGRKDERRNLAAELLGGAQRSTVQLRPLPLAGPQRHLQLETRPAALAMQHDASGVLAEPEELCVRPRAWREPLRPDVQRLEQVRLAGAVRPDDQDEPRLEVEFEPRVRPDVAQGDRRNDQTA